jgi:hypothetical protein
MTNEEVLDLWAQAVHTAGLKNPHSFNEITEFANLVSEKATEEANARATASWTHMCEKMVALEREACAKVVDHILKEGGGTYGDAIRARKEST